MGETKDIDKEIISAWGKNFADQVDKMVLEDLIEWVGKPKKPKGIPILSGRISKIKVK